MNTQTITINKVDYTVKFGIQSNLQLGKMWNVTKFSQIGKKLKKIAIKPGGEPTMEQLKLVADLILSGVLAVQPRAKIDCDHIIELLFNDFDVAVQLMELYTDSQPKTPAEKLKNVKPDRTK